MKKPDLFVQKIGSSFFDNDILPQSNAAYAQNFFKRRCLRVARNASTHERAHKILPPKLLFIEDFCRDFCARQEVCGFCDGNLQNVKDQILRPQTLSRRFLQRFLRVARNASTHERSVPKRTRPRARAVRQSHTQKDRKNHSHSMVAGGFEVISYTTRFACFTSFTIRVEIFSRTS